MDPQLPAQLVQFLAPYLPYLLKGLELAGQERVPLTLGRLWRAEARSLAQPPASGQTVTANGNRSVAIGGNASGSVIVTGDGNKINKR